MGVTGLWRLIEPSGKPVPLETLENKILAVDISIWLHQAIKGFQDSKGTPVPNAHLLGIYHRVCKLLYFRIKPVFVFDGGVPALKKQTIAKRNQSKAKSQSEADKIQKQLINALLKHSAISKVLSEKAKASLEAAAKPSVKTNRRPSKDDIFKLPEIEQDSALSSSQEDEEEGSESSESSPVKRWDLHSIDEKSPHFQSLPADVRHEILTELKETRKQSSWDRIHEIPKESGDFSNYQMKRLLKRYSVQVSLEEAEKEMGGHSLSLGELETLLQDQGVVNKDVKGKRIASDENTRFLLIKDVKKAMEDAKKEEEKRKIRQIDKAVIIDDENNELKPSTSKADDAFSKHISTEDEDLQLAIQLSLEGQTKDEEVSLSSEDRDLEKAIQLSLQCESDSVEKPKESPKKMEFSFLNNSEFQMSSDSEEEIQMQNPQTLSSAKNYMIEYSGLTPNEIEKIIGSNTAKSNKTLKINKQKTFITEKSKENQSRQLVKQSIQISNEKIEAVHDRESKEPSQKNVLETNEKDKNTFEKSSVIEVKESNKELPQILEKTKEKTQDLPQTSEERTKNEVKGISSKNTEDESKKKFEKSSEENKNGVELISDSDSEDLLEVPTTEKQTDTKPNCLFEIVIKPTDLLEDDLFSDIFTKPEKEDMNSTEKKYPTKSLSPISVLPTIPEEIKESLKTSNEKNMQLEHFLEVDNKQEINEDNQEKKSESNENPQSSRLTRLQNKEKVIGELMQSLKKAQNVRKDSEEILLKPSIDTLDTNQLEEIQENLLQEQRDLIAEKSSKERLATNITDQMYQEAQELLQLFGVPYVIAPMEAEAQCAFLEMIDLTDGTITDDSDIWLFGGKTVYKNFFNQSKHVLEFRAEDIKHHFKLTREQMVLLALLVGSDYTAGLQGIGPVTALEVLAAFPPPKMPEFSISHQQLLSGLSEFRAWLTGQKTSIAGKTTLRNKLKNVVFTDNFPSYQVVEAYLDPTVDTSKEPFSWSKPDIVSLTDLAKAKFGWTRQKSEEILKPVIKRMEEKHVQRSIRDYFKTKFKLHSTEAESKMSKRVQKAIKKIGNGNDASDEEEKVGKGKKPRQKRERKTDKDGTSAGKTTGKKQSTEERVTIDKDEEEDFQTQKPKSVRGKVQSSEKQNVLNLNENTTNTQSTKAGPNLSKLLNKDTKPRNIKRQTRSTKNQMKSKNSSQSDTENRNDIQDSESKSTPSTALESENVDDVDDENLTAENAPQKKRYKRNIFEAPSYSIAKIEEEPHTSRTLSPEPKPSVIETKTIDEPQPSTSTQNSNCSKNKTSSNKRLKNSDGPEPSSVLETETIDKAQPSTSTQISKRSKNEANSNKRLKSNDEPAPSSVVETETVREPQPSTSSQTSTPSKNEVSSNKKLRSNDEDEEMRILKNTLIQSKSKLEQIRSQLMEELNKSTKSPKEKREIIRDVSGPISPLDRLKKENIHRKDVIPQKEQDKLTLMRRKMKAVEILKTSKRGSKKKQKTTKVVYCGTHYLSESSSDEDKGK